MKVSDYNTNNNHSCAAYLETIVNIDKAALPMLLLYQGGDIIHTLIGAEHEFNNTLFTKDDISW